MVKTPQANAPLERLQEVILSMLVNKYLDNNFLDYIDPWGETLASIAWLIRTSYHCTIMSTPGQAVIGINILFKLASFVDYKFATAAKQCHVDIDNARENAKRDIHSYSIGDPGYVEMTGIYHKLHYGKERRNIITEVITKITVRVQQVQVNEQINIRQLKHHFDE